MEIRTHGARDGSGTTPTMTTVSTAGSHTSLGYQNGAAASSQRGRSGTFLRKSEKRAFFAAACFALGVAAGRGTGPSLRSEDAPCDCSSRSDGSSTPSSFAPKMARPRATMNVEGQEPVPRRLITVIGLENSGTKVMTQTLSLATGILTSDSEGVEAEVLTRDTDFIERAHDRAMDTEIIHMSQPWGWDETCGGAYLDAPALFPEGCSRGGIRSVGHGGRQREALPDACRRAGLRDFFAYPEKFFVNVTSHISWYEERGVETVTVLCVRDKTVSFLGKIRERCSNPVAATRELRHGQYLLDDIFRLAAGGGPISGKPKILLVSYETLMTFTGTYMRYIYNELGINSTYIPEIRDGNKRYIRRGNLSSKMKNMLGT